MGSGDKIHRAAKIQRKQRTRTSELKTRNDNYRMKNNENRTTTHCDAYS